MRADAESMAACSLQLWIFDDFNKIESHFLVSKQIKIYFHFFYYNIFLHPSGKSSKKIKRNITNREVLANKKFLSLGQKRSFIHFRGKKNPEWKSQKNYTLPSSLNLVDSTKVPHPSSFRHNLKQLISQSRCRFLPNGLR